MSEALIGILDVGKTHAKFLLVEAGSGRLVAQQERLSQAVEGPLLRSLDIVGIERWLRDALFSSPDRTAIQALVPIAHGAAAVLLDDEDQILFAPDYEDPAFELVADTYRNVRDPFSVTFSPFLPLGQNLGRQLHYLQAWHTTQFKQVTACLLYPQYWAWRLSGVQASELTSLGCHTDLWRPLDSKPSSLSERKGWNKLLPPLRRAFDTLGTVSDDMARATGLKPNCRVVCGIHDSNASYWSHRIEQRTPAPFAVVSSGTWTVCMAHGTNLARLQESADMLANVDAWGEPVATARFMGGRDYAEIAGDLDPPAAPSIEALTRLIRQRIWALPAPPLKGPRGEYVRSLVYPCDLSPVERATLATLYVALMTDQQLTALGAIGDIVIDGPLAANVLYAPLLATLRPDSRVRAGDDRAAIIKAACDLAGTPIAPQEPSAAISPLSIPGLADYRAEWAQRATPTRAAQ